MCKWIKSGNQRIDPCMKKAIDNVNWLGKNIGIKTLACCCGHNVYSPTVVIQKPDGTIRDWWTDTIIPRQKRFYKRDSNGVFFIPEVEQLNSQQTKVKP